jgi:hypothetical protein
VPLKVIWTREYQKKAYMFKKLIKEIYFIVYTTLNNISKIIRALANIQKGGGGKGKRELFYIKSKTWRKTRSMCPAMHKSEPSSISSTSLTVKQRE